MSTRIIVTNSDEKAPGAYESEVVGHSITPETGECVIYLELTRPYNHNCEHPTFPIHVSHSWEKVGEGKSGISPEATKTLVESLV
jgi:hypothetical protein